MLYTRAFACISYDLSHLVRIDILTQNTPNITYVGRRAKYNLCTSIHRVDTVFCRKHRRGYTN